MKFLLAFVLVLQLVLGRWVDGFEDLNVTELSYLPVGNPLMVPLTLIRGAAAKGAGISFFTKISSFLLRLPPKIRR